MSYAPFLSLANRGDLFANDDNPGPGQYDLRTDRSLTVKVSETDLFQCPFSFLLILQKRYFTRFTNLFFLINQCILIERKEKDHLPLWIMMIRDTGC